MTPTSLSQVTDGFMGSDCCVWHYPSGWQSSGMAQLDLLNRRFHGLYNMATLVIASMEDHATYGKLAAGFNALCLNVRPPIPTLEERLGRYMWDRTLLCR